MGERAGLCFVDLRCEDGRLSPAQSWEAQLLSWAGAASPGMQPSAPPLPWPGSGVRVRVAGLAGCRLLALRCSQGVEIL